MKLFAPDINEQFERMAAVRNEIDSYYRNELIKQGLGAVVIRRKTWSLEYNPLIGWCRSKQAKYKTLEQLKHFKNTPIHVIGLEDSAVKDKNLLQLINEYGAEYIIKVELCYALFWFLEPKRPSYRFLTVLVAPWSSKSEAKSIANIYKMLTDAVKK